MKKILMKMDKGVVLGSMVAILLIGNFLWIVSEMDYIPFTKRFFLSYHSFKYDAEAALFPDELPLSSRDIKYYYYTGHMDSKTGVAFVVEDEKEYKLFKETWMSEYSEYMRDVEGVDNITYVFNQPLTNNFMKEGKIEFLEDLLEKGVVDFQIVAYENIKQSEKDRTDGMMCNDITHEIIIFDFWDAHS